MDAPQILLRRLIDDAGLFPPARKSMDDAICDHAAARASTERFMLGRFLCPASRLGELADRASEVPELGAIFDAQSDDWFEGVETDLDRVQGFARCADVTSIEVPLAPGRAEPAMVEAFVRAVQARRLDEQLVAFLEVSSLDPDEIEQTLEAIAAGRGAMRLGAKLRCGGVSAPAFPTVPAVAAFIATARRLGLPFKATAGLHHPFRTVDQQLGVLQHGFINLLAAAALPNADTHAVIREPDPVAFQIDPNGLRWRAHRADTTALACARELFTAFGSCSFDEPVQDLRAHGILPAAVPA